MSTKVTKTTSSRRRSLRIRKRQTDPEEKEENQIFKIKLRNHSLNDVKEQDVVNLKGDIHHKYNDGDCVWAKYSDYPWWPGQIEIDRKRKRGEKKAKTITVRWFGDDFHEEVNHCKLAMVVPWDPDEIDRIYVEVDEEDAKCFQDAVDECNDVYLQICQERGQHALKTAELFDNKQRKKKKGAPKRKNGKKTKRGVKEKKEGDDEQPQDAGAAESGTPEIETMDNGNEQQKAAPLEEREADDVNERKKSLRSAKKSKPKPTPKVKLKVIPATQSKTKRKRERQRKDCTASSSASSQSQDRKDMTKNIKRARKRKYEEAMNGDKNPEKEQGEDEDIDAKNKKVLRLRRSARVNKKQQAKEKEVDAAVNEKYEDSECGNNLNAAFAECKATLFSRSRSGFTPWIALFYFGMRTHIRSGCPDGDFIQTVANTFQVEADQVLHHLSEFVERQSENSRKKR